MSLKIRTLQCSLAPSFPTLSLISINVFYQVPHKEVRVEQTTLHCCSLQGGTCPRRNETLLLQAVLNLQGVPWGIKASLRRG